MLRAQGRHRHQPLRARHAAPVGRYRPDLSAGAAARRSLGAIDKAMQRIAGRVAQGIKGAQVTKAQPRRRRHQAVRPRGRRPDQDRGDAGHARLRLRSRAARRLAGGRRRFGFAEMQVLSFADLYAGKIVAALDRQHPRDLFDVRDLLANEGIDDALRARLHRLSAQPQPADGRGARPCGPRTSPPSSPRASRA